MLHQRRVAKSAYGANSPTRESRDFWAFFGVLHIVREGGWRASEAKLTLETRLAEDRLVGSAGFELCQQGHMIPITFQEDM
jgi:hypothetical protein